MSDHSDHQDATAAGHTDRIAESAASMHEGQAQRSTRARPSARQPSLDMLQDGKLIAALEGAGRPLAELSPAAATSSGLMIDGFMVPPHVVQALSQLHLSRDAMRSRQPAADGAENHAWQTSDAADSMQVPPDQSASPPIPITPASPYASDSPAHSIHSSGGRSGRGQSAWHGTSSGRSSRGSSLSSGRSSGRSSNGGRGTSSSLAEDYDDGVALLEDTVAQLQSRSTANAGIIVQLTSDVACLGETNEVLRVRLETLTHQLRNREVEIDSLRGDVRRMRDIVIARNAAAAKQAIPQ